MAELRSDVESLERRVSESAAGADNVQLERIRDDHLIRTAAAKADVALRRAAEIASGSRAKQPVRLVGGALDLASETPAVAGEALLVRGWALLEPGPVARVEVRVAGELVAHVRVALPRADVSQELRHPDAPASGFEAFILVPRDEGSSQLAVDASAVGLDGSQFRLGAVTLPILAPLEPNERQDVSNRLVGPPSHAPRGPKDGSLRLVVFAHSLDYAGAELRMLDLLRDLAAEPGFRALVVSGRDGPLREELETLGAEVVLTEGWGVGGVEEYEAWQQAVGSQVLEWEPDAALAVTIASFAGVDLAARLNVPCVWSIHEFAPLPFFLAFVFPFEARVHPYVAQRAAAAFNAAPVIVYQAESQRSIYAAHGGGESAVIVSPGVDLDGIAEFRAGMDRSKARWQLGIDESAKVILYVATVHPGKGQTRLVQAFRELADRHLQAQLVLVGDSGGPYSDALTELVKQSNLADRVRIVPTQRDVWPWFAAADFFVCPSYAEVIPNVILQAAAFELPVLASAVGAIPEFIDDGVSGFLCWPDDLASLIDGLERILGATDAVRATVIETAFERVHERHDVRKRISAFREVLARTAASHTATAV